MRLRTKIFRTLAAAGVLAVAGGVWYVKAHPLIFNESFFEHAHCLAQTDGLFTQYAMSHNGRFPSHTNGYGDALLLLEEIGGPRCFSLLTGPCYDAAPFERAFKTKSHLSETDCGRVYIQGFTATNNPAIAILFDKIATPGGDHCHFFDRFKYPLQRDVLFVGGQDRVLESDWPEFSRKQIALLVEAGFTREQAEAFYRPVTR